MAHKRLATIAAAGHCALAGVASAQVACSTRPITLVAPQVAGGTNDMVGRLVGQKLAEVLGGTAVVDNRPGAGGNIGTRLVDLSKWARIVKSSGAAVD
ncbi:tripartite tricarboxylate transporter substrate-binding protein [Pseudorhodoferax sp. Leaf267]|uniref:tripartite tricarboxylate transporter substrate-binding protein n=1 Tax=Pseudorhodoferax sp. Leaf267 TaxID=1736316 RepID=UPI0006F9F285